MDCGLQWFLSRRLFKLSYWLISVTTMSKGGLQTLSLSLLGEVHMDLKLKWMLSPNIFCFMLIIILFSLQCFWRTACPSSSFRSSVTEYYRVNFNQRMWLVALIQFPFCSPRVLVLFQIWLEIWKTSGFVKLGMPKIWVDIYILNMIFIVRLALCRHKSFAYIKC